MEFSKNDMKQLIVYRALKDPDFKKRLLKNAKGTIEQEFQTTVPADFEISAVEENRKKMVLVIPDTEGREMEDQELFAIAGGGREATYLENIQEKGYAAGQRDQQAIKQFFSDLSRTLESGVVNLWKKWTG